MGNAYFMYKENQERSMKFNFQSHLSLLNPFNVVLSGKISVEALDALSSGGAESWVKAINLLQAQQG